MATASVSNQKTISEILAHRDTVRAEIHENARVLQARLEAIKDCGYDRPLKAAEIAEMGAINAALGSLRAAENELVIMTVRALDQVDEVTRMINVLNGINVNLENTVKRVQRVAKHIEKVGTMFKGIEKVISALSKLAKLLV